jgi:hypothetical protein
MRWSSVVTAFPDARGPSQYSCKGGIRLSMLPGFRFLFVAIVLSMSILVFGLGAAALLRAAHEEFVSAPSWRAVPETIFAQQSDATRPVLATLSVAAPVTGQNKPLDDVPAATVAPPPPASPEPAAALKNDDLSLPEPVKPGSRPAETPVPSAAVPASGDAPAADATNTTVSEPSSPLPSEAAPASTERANAPAVAEQAGASAAVEQAATPAAVEQASAPASAAPASAPPPDEPRAVPAPATDAAPTKVVTLDSASVSVEQPASKREIMPARIHHGEKRHQQAARATHRRNIAQRPHITAAASPQPAPAASPTSSIYYSVPAGGW